MPRARSLTCLAALPLLLAACGVPPNNTDQLPPPQTDGSASAPDLAQTASGDGTPMRTQCTGSFGSGLSTAHGRLDGYLVAIVPPSAHGCNADSHHVHLQVSMHGAIYDVAVDVVDNSGGAVFLDEKDLALPDGAWAEGWHPGDALSYVSLGLHASSFTATPGLEGVLMSRLASANHVSIFATGYNSSGCHLVHYESGNDGAIVINPLSPTAHFILLHFANQNF